MPQEGLLRLSGGLRYAPIFSHRYIMLFNFDPIGIRRQSLLLLRCGQRDVQDCSHPVWYILYTSNGRIFLRIHR